MMIGRWEKSDKSAKAKTRKETPAFGGIVYKSRGPKRAASIELAALIKAKFLTIILQCSASAQPVYNANANAAQ